MAEVSPSSKKVDDFLSSISQLSQERLKEDQQRQRDLQRNVDDLRLSLNSSSPVKGSSYQSSSFSGSARGHDDIPLLKFNRGLKLNNDHFLKDLKDFETDELPQVPQRPESSGTQCIDSKRHEFNESPPPMPHRPANEEDESPPPMPPRRYSKKSGPSIPSKPTSMSSQFQIELINPVARKTRPETPTNKSFNLEYDKPSTQPKKDNKYRSFADLENDVRDSSDIGNKTSDMVDELFSVESTTNSKPIKPIKSDELSVKPNAKDKIDGPNVVPKPSYFSALSATKYQPKQSLIPSSTFGTKQKYIPEHNDPSDVSIIKSPSPQREKKQNAWLDSAIKKNDTPESPVKEKATLYKSTHPIRSESTSLLAKSKTPDFHSPEFKTPPKPPKPSLEKYTQKDNELLKSQMQKLASSKKPVPLKPTKPSIMKYEQDDTELLKSQMQKLSHSKAAPPKPSKPSPKRYQDEDNAILLSQMKKLGKKSTSSSARESTKQPNPEGLAALAKLKPVKAPQPKSAPNPSKSEQVKKLEQIKTSDKIAQPKPDDDRKRSNPSRSPSTSDLNETTTKSPTSIQDQLSKIIRASTVPNVRASKPAPNISRANTTPLREDTEDSSNSKLTHPNKGRSKGPKRRLPKKVASNTLSADHSFSASTNTKADDKPKPFIDIKKRTPPPINKATKQKALDNLKPSRDFSGELFI